MVWAEAPTGSANLDLAALTFFFGFLTFLDFFSSISPLTLLEGVLPIGSTAAVAVAVAVAVVLVDPACCAALKRSEDPLGDTAVTTGDNGEAGDMLAMVVVPLSPIGLGLLVLGVAAFMLGRVGGFFFFFTISN